MSPMANALSQYLIDAVLVLALWLVLAVLGSLVHAALRRLSPSGLGAWIRDLLAFRPSLADPGEGLQSRIEGLHAKTLSGASMRAVLERRHGVLAARLRTIRADFDGRMRQISAASGSGSAPTLIALLQDFKRDVAVARDFGAIEDGMVDRRVDFDQQRARFRLSIVGSLVIGLLNSLLLWVFFRDLEVGVFIPWTRLDVMMVFPFLLPAVEFMVGFFSELNSDRDGRGMRTFVKWFGVAGLAMVEAFIFFLLFKNILENAELAQYTVWGLVGACFIGPALTLFQASVGAGAGRAKRLSLEYGTEMTIRQQILDANSFVDGLPARFDGMALAARNAAHSVDQLAIDLHGRDEANLPVASAIDEQRRLFLEAIDRANPARWPGDLAGNEEDGRDAVRYAWMLPGAMAALAAAYVYLVHGFMDKLALFGAEADVPRWAAAIGTAAGCLLIGGFLFPKVGTATQRDGQVRDTLFPRDDVPRMVALAFAAALAVATGAAAIGADGWLGVVEGLFAITVGCGLVLLGGYVDLLGRGLGFLSLALAVAVLALVRSLANAIVVLGFAIAAALFCAIYFASFVVGWPVLAILERLKSRTTAPATSSQPTSDPVNAAAVA